MHPWFNIADLIQIVLQFVGFPAFARFSSTNTEWRKAALSINVLRSGTLVLGREIVPLADSYQADPNHFDPEHTSQRFRESTTGIAWLWKRVASLELRNLDSAMLHFQARDCDVTDTIFHFMSQIEQLTQLTIRMQWPFHVDTHTMCEFRAQASMETLLVEGPSMQWLNYITRGGCTHLSALKHLTVMHMPQLRHADSAGVASMHVFHRFPSELLCGSPIEKLDLWYAELQAWNPIIVNWRYCIGCMPHLDNLRELKLHYCSVSVQWLSVLPKLDLLVLFECNIPDEWATGHNDMVNSPSKTKVAMCEPSLYRLFERMLQGGHLVLWPTTAEFDISVWDALVWAQPDLVEIACSQGAHDAVRDTLDAMFDSLTPSRINTPLLQLQLTVGAGWTMTIPGWTQELKRINERVPPAVARSLRVTFLGANRGSSVQHLLKQLRQECQGWKVDSGRLIAVRS